MADELTLTTPVNDVFRRDYEVADPTLLDPTDPDSLIMGEWLVRNTGNPPQLVRATVGTVRGAMQVFTPKGDFSAQAIGKVTVLQLHEYEAETTTFVSTLTPAIGDPLTVQSGDIGDGVTRGCFAAATTADYVYAIVTKTPANNAGRLGFTKVTSTTPLA